MYKIKNKRVVIIGAGEVAFRKVKDLTEAGAECIVIAPDINPELIEFASSHQNIRIINRTYQYGDCKDAALVFSATNNSAVNNEVYKEASQLNIPVNAVDDPENSSFYVPSFFTRGPLLVAVSTGGYSPALAAKIRRYIEQAIPDDIEIMLHTMNEIRKYIKEVPGLSVNQRSSILKMIVNDENLLIQAVDAYKNNSLKIFISTILKNNNS